MICRLCVCCGQGELLSLADVIVSVGLGIQCGSGGSCTADTVGTGCWDVAIEGVDTFNDVMRVDMRTIWCHMHHCMA
jgi:hypothetical protein